MIFGFDDSWVFHAVKITTYAIENGFLLRKFSVIPFLCFHGIVVWIKYWCMAFYKMKTVTMYLSKLTTKSYKIAKMLP